MSQPSSKKLRNNRRLSNIEMIDMIEKNQRSVIIQAKRKYN